MTLYKWSTTAANNATADATINWAEGQAPSSVNDSARAEMAAVAKFRDDIAGAITTGGTSTAYTVTSNQAFNSLANMSGKMVAFVPHTTNGATVTLNVDGLGAKPLRSAPSTELLAGVLVQGTPYVATYNNAANEWLLHGFYGNPYNVPLGGMLEFTGTTAPNSSFVLPFGQAISRTTYAAYFAMVGTTYGAGDGSTTFNVIDKRGRVSAGKDDMGGAAASRLTATYFGTSAAALGAVGGSESHTLTTAQMPSHTHSGTTDSAGSHTHNAPALSTFSGYLSGGGLGAAIGYAGGDSGFATTSNGAHTHTFTSAATGAGNAHPNVQPTVIVNYILRIL
jgi:microcystin-dependent protein